MSYPYVKLLLSISFVLNVQLSIEFQVNANQCTCTDQSLKGHRTRESILIGSVGHFGGWNVVQRKVHRSVFSECS